MFSEFRIGRQVREKKKGLFSYGSTGIHRVTAWTTLISKQENEINYQQQPGRQYKRTSGRKREKTHQNQGV